MRRSDSSDNPDPDSACAPASAQQAPEREARPAAFIGPNDRPDLLTKMVDEPIRGFVEASRIEEGEERPILAQGAASADEDKDEVDKINFDKGGAEKTEIKDETDKINFDKGGEEKMKEVSDKEKEVSDKESDKEKEVSEKGKEFEEEVSGGSATLSIEEWASRHQSEAARFINPGPQDELL